VAETLHAIIGHRRNGAPFTIEAGIVRVADALDMARGRSRFRSESGIRTSIRSRLTPSSRFKIPPPRRAVRVEIDMSNSAGIFQVDELPGREAGVAPAGEHIEVIARIGG